MALQSLNVSFRLKDIHCFDEGDGNGNAEPFLWVVYFKIDGDTVFLGDDLMLHGSASVIGTPGSHGNLPDGIDAGRTFPIPSVLGSFKTTLRPIPSPLVNLTIGGVAGFIAILLEEDSTSDDDIKAGHRALNNAVQKGLDKVISTLGLSSGVIKDDITDEELQQLESSIENAVLAAVEDEVDFFQGIWSYIGFGNGQDDKIGTAKYIGKYANLANGIGTTGALDYTWNNEGKWRMNATVTVHKTPNTHMAPAAMSFANHLYVVMTGEDNHIYINRAAEGQAFTGWNEVQGNGTTDVAAGAGALGRRLYVFAKGINDKKIYVNSALDGKPFDGFGFGWSPLPDATTNASPASATLGNRLYVFAKGITDKKIYVNSAADGQAFDGWGQGWAAVPGMTTNVAPAAATLGNRIYVFATGSADNQVYVNSAVSGKAFDGWGHGWSVLPGIMTDVSPASASLGSRIYVFIKGLNNHIYVKSAIDGQSFGDWKEVEGNGTTDVALGAASLGNRIYVFAKGINDKRIYVNSALAGQPFDGWGAGWSEVQW